MPYINQDRRPNLDEIVQLMHENNLNDGDLNFILFAYCKRHVPRSYFYLKNYLGEITEAGAEIRRRILVELENEKIASNGDIE